MSAKPAHDETTRARARDLAARHTSEPGYRRCLHTCDDTCDRTCLITGS